MLHVRSAVVSNDQSSETPIRRTPLRWLKQDVEYLPCRRTSTLVAPPWRAAPVPQPYGHVPTASLLASTCKRGRWSGL